MSNTMLKPNAVFRDALPNPTLLWGEDSLSTSTTQSKPERKPYFCLICRQDLPGHDSAYQHWSAHERERIAKQKKVKSDG